MWGVFFALFVSFQVISSAGILDVDQVLSAIKLTFNGSDNYKVSENDVSYRLDSRNLSSFPSNLFQLNDTTKPIKFIVHGWTENNGHLWIKTLTDALLEVYDAYVIAVDWQKAASIDYAIAAKTTKEVGHILGDQIASLINQEKIPLRNIHIIGFSLGAHVAGFAGKRVFAQTGGKVHKITGLDPAGPLFENFGAKKVGRLSVNDAEFVEIVHTDGGVFGFRTGIGDVDFFPNGGMALQPNCSVGPPRSIFEIRSAVSCSHQCSHKYYEYAMKVGGIPATKCGSWLEFEKGACTGNEQVLFGTDLSPDVKGNYYFKIVA